MGSEIAFRDVAQLVRNVVKPDEVAKIPYIGLEHIEQESLRLNGWGTSSDVNSAKFRFKKGDILFGKLRPYFRKVVRAPFDGICSTDIWVVRAREGCDQGYLFYWMASYDFVDFASKGSEGTRMPRAKWEHVERFTRPRLSLKEQRAIAHILGTLDDKIELNRRMNQTLEAMAQALFKSWFVDFDPVVVNALKAGNPIPEKFAKRAAHYRSSPLPVVEALGERAHSPLPLGEGAGERVYTSSAHSKSVANESKRKPPIPPQLLAYARELRKTQTDAERLMWRMLRNRQFLGIKFRRQHPIEPYIVDFYAHELGLVIEIDGGQHAEPAHKRYDEKRTEYLEQKGLKVIRYWSRDVLRKTEDVLQDLYERVSEIMSPSPHSPLPQGEGSGVRLPEHILRLFPDRFVDSELGPIPEGWEVGTIGQVLGELMSGARPKGGAAQEGIPSVGAENVIGLGRYNFSKEKYVPRDFFKVLQRKGAAVRPGDVLLYKDGAQIGRKTYFDCGFPHKECAVNEHVFIVRTKHPHYQRYLFFWLDQDWITQEIISLNSNSAQPGINKLGVRGLPLLMPSTEVVEEFDRVAKKFTDRLFKACHESRTLVALRDTLLPKLISGDLRVPDAQKLVEGSI
ncbi:MAG: DUF559 domain-containing protein [Desulfobulbaceae bacterium]|nr:DUF559 domain-containing protein [Desulfobulbaceae bacterium]